jgi:hypothetical protein
MTPEQAQRLQLKEVVRLMGGKPEELVPKLERFIPLLSNPEPTSEDESQDKKLIADVRELTKRLEQKAQVYATVEKVFGFQAPTIIDDTLTHLFELAEYLEGQLQAPREGGPTPNGRRLICATVCAELWLKVHGTLQPYNLNLQEACEMYWQASSNPATSGAENLKNWVPFLLQAKNADDEEFREFRDAVP